MSEWSPPKLVKCYANGLQCTLPDPRNLNKWGLSKLNIQPLCNKAQSTALRILAGCSMALQEGRYSWHHDKVLGIKRGVKFSSSQELNILKSVVGEFKLWELVERSVNLDQQECHLLFRKVGIKILFEISRIIIMSFLHLLPLHHSVVISQVYKQHYNQPLQCGCIVGTNIPLQYEYKLGKYSTL